MRALLLFFGLLLACGGNKAVSPGASGEDIEKDPIVLLPAGALGVASLDARALFADATLGRPVAAVADRYIPFGEEAGFSAARDLERIYAGSYALEGLDACAVLVGKFDAEKIGLAARNHTQTKAGVITESQYADHAMYSVGEGAFAVVSSKIALAGTIAGVRRALDRLKSGKLSRDLQPWMYETLETKGAAFAIASDVSSQNIAAMSLGPLNLSFLKGLRVIRAVGNFGGPGINVAGTTTFAEEAQAQSGADGFRGVAKLAAGFAAAGFVPQLQNLKIEPKGTDVQVSFALDSKQLANLLGQL